MAAGIAEQIDINNLKLVQALTELDAIYHLLILIVQFAFAKHYQEEITLVENLQLALWNRADLEEYVVKAISENSKQFILSMVEQNAFKVIEKIEMQLLTIISEIQCRQEKRRYPFIEKVIKELEIFKICHLPQLSKTLGQNDELKEKLSQLSEKCIFKITRSTEKEIIINLTNRNKLSTQNNELTDLLRGVWGALEKKLKEAIKINLDMEAYFDKYELKVSCSNTQETDKVAEIVTQLVNEFSRKKPTRTDLRNLFFNSTSTANTNSQDTANKATENEPSLICTLQ
jgi:hypothetical protein